MVINEKEFDGLCYKKSEIKKQEFITIKKELVKDNELFNGLYINHFIEDIMLYYFFPYRIDIDFAFKQTLDYTKSIDSRRLVSFNSLYNQIYLKKKGNKK